MFGQAAAPAPAPATATETSEEVVKLSPFVVSADEDQGYAATATLAGTRIRTELKDVASSISVVTQKFLQDTKSNNASELLVYTTSTEVAGQGGNYLGQGDGMYLTNAPTGAPTTSRVRGLAEAMNTRDFFLTDIPWDGYNVGRVDLQRGPNAILFGIGSPAGLVNTSLNQAAFKDSYKFEASFGSYGSTRGTADLNCVVIPNELAVRVALLKDDTKYRQDPAYKNDKRIYASLNWEPAALNRGSSHTRVQADFEVGSQIKNDPINTPPIDAITPWFTAYNAAQRAAGFSAADPAVYSPGTDVSTAAVQKYGIYLGNYNNSRPQGLGATDPWLGAPGGRVFDGVITAYSEGQPGIAYATKMETWPNNVTVAGTVLGNNGISGITTYAAGVGGYAGNAHLVGSTIGAFKAKSLTDASIFNFYNNLLSGPNQDQFNKFHAGKLRISQTFFDDKLGFELVYNRQNDYSGQNSFISNDATSISIDVMRTLIDGTLNPNFGRPVVYAGGGSAGFSWTDVVRTDTRATAFGDLDFADISGKDSILAKILGKNMFTALYSIAKTDTMTANGNRTYIADSFAPQAANGAVGQASRDDIFAIYLGSPLTGTSASNINLTGIKTTISPPTSQTVNYWNDSTNAWVPLSLQIVNNDLASNRYKTYRTARKTLDKVTSEAAVWQGFWLDNALVPMFGWRQDKDNFQDAGNPATAAANAYGQAGLVNPYDPSWGIGKPGSTNITNIVRSKTYGIVTHLPNAWRKNLPGNLDVGFSYDKSENFQPDSSRRDVMGDPVANPSGTTKEYGFHVSVLNDKLTLKVVHYETSVANATLNSSGISSQYLIGAVEAWGQKSAFQFKNSMVAGGPTVGNASTLYGYSTDGHQVTWQPDGPSATQLPSGLYNYTPAQLDATYTKENASVVDWFNTQVPASFQNAWALTDYATGGGSTNYGASGLVVTGNTLSKGWEYELIANPVKGLDITLNASKTFASRTDLEGSYTAWITKRWAQFQGAAGDMRLWGPADDSQSTNGLLYGASGETARGKFSRETMAGYNLYQALEGAPVPELRPWHANVIANYSFQQQALKAFNVGAAYRWQNADETGFPVIGAGTTNDPYRFDVAHPYKGSSEGIFDAWIGYHRKITSKVNWRIQLNVRDLFATNKLQVVTVEPDGSPAALRIPEPRTWTVTNTFEF
jgi:outer membrane receptor protein involved in Fe transport